MNKEIIITLLTTLILPLNLAARNSAGELINANQADLDKQVFIENATVRLSKLYRWRIEYECLASTNKPVRSIPVHRIVAVSAPGELYQFTAHFSKLQTWTEDPFCQDYFIHQGTTCHRLPFNRMYSEGKLEAGQQLPGTSMDDILFLIGPTWPISNYRSPTIRISGTPAMPIEAIRAPEFQLRKVPEVLAGVQCVIFDNTGRDTIWLALKDGACVMRRDIRDFRTGMLAERLITEKVAEIAPGLRIPVQFRVQSFSASKGNGSEIIEREENVRILRCDINEKIPDSLFVVQQKPGSIKSGNGNEFTQTYPGGEDLLSETVHFMVKYAGLPTKTASHNRDGLALAVGLAGGLSAGFLVSQFIKNRSRGAAIPTSPIDHT